jgi:fibronectin-binding autotransporter adhesin
METAGHLNGSGRYLLLKIALLVSLVVVSGWSFRSQASGPWYVSPAGSDSVDCLTPATACRTIGAAVGRAASGDTINVGAGIYSETLTISADLNINGAGARATIINGGAAAGVLSVYTSSATVRISDLTITGGQSIGSGGGITNFGRLTLANSAVSGNVVSPGEGFQGIGGGIANLGTLTISNSTVISNTAVSGGGIYNAGMLTITNTTISGNTARNDGGGIVNSGTGTMSLNNITIAHNTADSDTNGSGDGGGLASQPGGAVDFRNTLLAGNTDSGGQAPECSGTLTSQGHNLIQSTAGCAIGGDTTGNLIGQDARIGPLLDNGGPTPTHALLPDSPALDAGDNQTCASTDQRDVTRPQGSVCDIGAYERVAQTENTWYVAPTGDDSHDCLSPASACRMIGAAITKAANGDTIDVAAGTYSETLILPISLTIIGAGADVTTIDSGGHGGVLAINSAALTVRISDLTITGGQSIGSGGGITNFGTLILSESTVSRSQVSLGEGFQGLGGGIANFGTLTISNSAVISNTGFVGGGIYSTGILTATNVTISGNMARNDSGGLMSGGSGAVSLDNVTITNNTADADNNGNGTGGGIANAIGSRINLSNTMVAGNTDRSGQAPDCSGTLTSQGHNLIQNTAGCNVVGDDSGNLTGQDAKIGLLRDNGGPTLTHALLPGSPAIDTGSPELPASCTKACASTDQRGIPRPQDGDGDSVARCDIGAYELQPPQPVLVPRLVLPVMLMPRACPCSIWSDQDRPTVDSDPDAVGVELGVKFRSDVDGYVRGLRFYKSSANTGTHVGNLWAADGTPLASATFMDETASGWQAVAFVPPVAITANTIYVASYYAPAGHYAADERYFARSGVVNAPLRALADGEDGPNGIYVYGDSAFPDQTFNASNYWVDVTFTER